MLSFKPLLYKLLNPFANPTSAVTSVSDSTIFSIPLKSLRQPRTARICCFGHRAYHPKSRSKMPHRVEIILCDQTVSTLSADEYEEEAGKTTLVDTRPVSEKGFKKVSGSKLTWHGETAHTLDEWNHLNSVSTYVPLSPIALWEDTDVDLENEESYDWFGERPPVILTTGSNSIFLRHVLPGLKLISLATSPTSINTSAVSLVQRVAAWFGR